MQPMSSLQYHLRKSDTGGWWGGSEEGHFRISLCTFLYGVDVLLVCVHCFSLLFSFQVKRGYLGKRLWPSFAFLFCTSIFSAKIN